MNIVDELKDLLDRYNGQVLNQDEFDNMNNINQNDNVSFGDIKFPNLNENNLNHRMCNSAYITYGDWEHSFFVEHKKYIAFVDLQNIRDKYTGMVSENKNYSNVIDASYNMDQLNKDIENNWYYNVYRDICKILDISLTIFESHFKIRSNCYKGCNLYFYPKDIKRIINDEQCFKNTEKNKYLEGINSSKICCSKLKNILNTHYSNDKDIEDDVLEAFCCLYQKDYKELKRWASEKSGFGIGGHIAVDESVWKEIDNLWKEILAKYPTIFSSNRFAENDLRIKSYGSYNTNLIDAINNILSSSNIDIAWIEFHKIIHSTFYGRPFED